MDHLQFLLLKIGRRNPSIKRLFFVNFPWFILTIWKAWMSRFQNSQNICCMLLVAWEILKKLSKNAHSGFFVTFKLFLEDFAGYIHSRAKMLTVWESAHPCLSHGVYKLCRIFKKRKIADCPWKHQISITICYKKSIGRNILYEIFVLCITLVFMYNRLYFLINSSGFRQTKWKKKLQIPLIINDS